MLLATHVGSFSKKSIMVIISRKLILGFNGGFNFCKVCHTVCQEHKCNVMDGKKNIYGIYKTSTGKWPY